MSDEVRLELVLPADPQQVYDAWTQPALLEQWYCPNPALELKVQADVRDGGEYVVAMGPHVVRGTYHEVEPTHRLRFDWRWDGDTDSPTNVLVELTPDPAGTRLRFLHNGFATPEDAKNHRIAWQPTLDRLSALLLGLGGGRG
jgi:uncharacterized protein YndB with AHSA1/START domain